jgi:AcrR family transcriptional regulator
MNDRGPVNENLIQPDARPSRADAVKNRALILETAQRLFAAQGVEEVSMSTIAEAAGIGKGTLYRHFESKGELCHALLDQDQRDLQERTLRRLADPDGPAEKLCWFLESVVQFDLRNEALLQAASGHFSETPLSHPAQAWWRQTIYGLLKPIQPAQDMNYVADVLYLIVDIRNIQYLLHERSYTPDQIIQGLHTTFHALIR